MTPHHVSQFCYYTKNTAYNQYLRRESLFWFAVLGSHRLVGSLFATDRVTFDGGSVKWNRTNCLPHGWKPKRARRRLKYYGPFKDMPLALKTY